MVGRLVLDIRETYHVPALAGAIRLPLGLLLADPRALPDASSYEIVGQDERDARFAARVLCERGLDAHAR